MTLSRSLLFLAAVLLFQAFSSDRAFSQDGSVNWSSLKEKSTDSYALSVPADWSEMDNHSVLGYDEYFEASGKFLPLIFNNNPVIVTLALTKTDSYTSLDDAKEKIIKGYKENEDRLFPEVKNYYSSESVKLGSGKKAYIINTRYFRKSKSLHQSRYDLVSFNNDKKSGFIYTFTIQYYDEDYSFENEFKLKETAKKLYSYFDIK